jgi:hypothetical protein
MSILTRPIIEFHTIVQISHNCMDKPEIQDKLIAMIEKTKKRINRREDHPLLTAIYELVHPRVVECVHTICLPIQRHYIAFHLKWLYIKHMCIRNDKALALLDEYCRVLQVTVDIPSWVP